MADRRPLPYPQPKPKQPKQPKEPNQNQNRNQNQDPQNHGPCSLMTEMTVLVSWTNLMWS